MSSAGCWQARVACVAGLERQLVTDVAVGPLGCGYGGLDWVDVEPLIHTRLTPVADLVDIRIFPPAPTDRQASSPPARVQVAD